MSNREKPPRRPSTIRVVAQGDHEIRQMIRRMKAGAYRIAGGAVVRYGDLILPFFWPEDAGRETITAVERHHRKPGGSYWQDVAIAYEWLFSGPMTTPQPHEEAIARLDVRLAYPDTTADTFAVWFDARHQRAVLAYVRDHHCLMLCPIKPTLDQLRALDQSDAITLDLGESQELRDFLQRIPA